MQAIENENEVFKQAWKEWEPRVRTTIYPSVIEHVVGCSYDDLLSLARIVLLKALRTYRSNKAQFNTYFYTCLHNAIRTNYRYLGFKRNVYVISYLDDEDNVRIWPKRFLSSKAAEGVAVSKNLKDVEILPVDVSSKRIPVEHTCCLTPEMNDLVAEPRQVGSDIARSFLMLGRYLPDAMDQAIVIGLYNGENYSDICQKLEISYVEIKRRLMKIRRVVVKAARDGLVII